jgi:tetratricopeptide (TPR) repeat protein
MRSARSSPIGANDAKEMTRMTTHKTDTGPSPAQARILELLRVGNIREADARLREILSSDADNSFALGMLAQIEARQGRPVLALRATERLRQIEPTDPDVLRLHFDMLVTNSRYPEALEVLDELPADLRGRDDIMAAEADLAGRVGDHEREIALLEKLIERQPDNAGLRIGLANACRNVGSKAKASRLLEKVVASDPTAGKAWSLLADIKGERFSDEQLGQLQAAIASHVSNPAKSGLHFASAKAMHERKDHAAAFEHYVRANRLTNATTAGKPSEDEDQLRHAAHGFAEIITQADRTDDRRPIFVVGLQRSGSTLIEQILARHSRIEGLGELPVMAQIAREIVGDPDMIGTTLLDRMQQSNADKRREFADRYWQRARKYAKSDTPLIVDKMPGNWRRIGLILTLFPNARIVDARRHPMATGWSNFTQDYGVEADYSSDLAAFGAQYRRYLAFMEEIAPAAGERLSTFINERLVADPGDEVARLLDFIGVDFEPQCLDPHADDRAVRTPSAEQVRKPINSDGVDRWRAYEPWLAELEGALGDALERWDR